MVNLKLMIKNACEDDRTLATRLAKLIGYAKPNTIYKFYNEEDREMEFQQVLIIVQELWPDREFEIMGDYIRTLKPTQRCAREALEYLQLNQMNDLLVEHIEKLQKCSNKESQEWADTYLIHLEVKSSKLKKMDALEKINNTSYKFDEMKAFSKILQFYYYNDLNFINMMHDISDVIDKRISVLKESYVKSHYECRYLTTNAEINLHKNNINNLRNKILNVIDKISSHVLLNIVHVIIGNSYIFENYDEALKHFKKAIYHSEKIGSVNRTKQANKSINFLNSFWRKKAQFIEIDDEYNSNLTDYAFHKCNFSKEEGLKLLNDVDTSNFSDYGMGYYYYYLGIATGEEDYFFESVEFFNKAGEKYFKRMPIIELEKLGVKQSIIKALSV